MTVKVVTLAGDSRQEASLAIALSARGEIELLLRCVDRVELLGAIRSGRVDAIISVGQPEWFDKQCRDEAALAGARVIMVGPREMTGWPDGTAVLPAESSMDEIVAFAMDSPPIARAPASSESQRNGRLVAAWGPKGAPGRTRVAIELACEISTRSDPSFLLDGDPYGGDVAQLLGLVDELPTIIWASRLAAKDSLEITDLLTQLRRIGSNGPVVVPGLPRAELWAEISDYGWRELLEVARSHFRFTVVDVGFCLEPPLAEGMQDRNRLARAALRDADHIVAVCRPDAVGLKNFIWAFEDVRAVVQDTPISIVLNRATPKKGKEAAALLRRHVGRNVAAVVPEVPDVVDEAQWRGLAAREMQHNGDISAAMSTVAALVGATVPHRGLLGRLAGANR